MFKRVGKSGHGQWAMGMPVGNTSEPKSFLMNKATVVHILGPIKLSTKRRVVVAGKAFKGRTGGRSEGVPKCILAPFTGKVKFFDDFLHVYLSYLNKRFGRMAARHLLYLLHNNNFTCSDIIAKIRVENPKIEMSWQMENITQILRIARVTVLRIAMSRIENIAR